MRYFATISYQGTNYSGWQIQPHSPSVQEIIQKKLSTLLKSETKITGCGRTDAGVHAKGYVLHFDTEIPFDDTLLFKINKMLPNDIVFHKVTEVEPSAHTRFDANYRAYQYFIGAKKDPFNTDIVYHYPMFHKLNKDRMQAAAKLLLEYKEFTPFCKTHSDAKTMICDLHQSEWNFDKEGRMVYHIAANRFLRGMVRLIVGMCLNVGLGKVKIETVRAAMDNQTLLTKSLSAPPHGLFLMDIRYPNVSGLEI
ncbi:MAG: tRNA pseudouridine(38-40) synthase TruA [Saprospiraceae bacterium]